MDTTGWTPVRDGSGAVVGWMAPADVETPHEKQLRNYVVGARAAAVDEVAGLFGEMCLDPGDTWDSAAESGVSEAALDAAGNVIVELTAIESMADFFRP